MDELRDVGLPGPSTSAPPPGDDPESRALARLADELALAPRVVVAPAAEEAFYRLNHLDGRLTALFEGIASHDPDEDEIEEAAPAARRLLAGHVLLDAWVDAFYDACRSLPARVRVRRAGESGRAATNGRPALLALRRTWAEPWRDEAIVDRLRAGGPLRPRPAATIVHGDDRPADAALQAAVAQRIGTGWRAFLDEAGGLTRLEPTG
jgi:hypothetical protein